MANIVVIGSLNMDVVAFAPRIPVVGETIIGTKYFTEPGGKGANQAYAAARLGGQVAMLGRIGSDDFGRRMRDNLAKIGCDVSGVGVVEGASGVALIFVAADGHNSIVVVPGANSAFSLGDISGDASRLSGARAVLLQLENPIATVLAAARTAHEMGARVILDPAPAPGQPLPEELYGVVDIMTPNETEAAILAGRPPGRLDQEEAIRVAQQLLGRGVPAVIIKMGDQGCVLVEKEKAALISAPRVDAIDTTAAGDVFNGALAVALGENESMQSACRFAVYASALSVTRLGTQIAMPTRSEVDEFSGRFTAATSAY